MKISTRQYSQLRISCKTVAKMMSHLILRKQLNDRVTNYKDFWFFFLCLGNKSCMLHQTHIRYMLIKTYRLLIHIISQKNRHYTVLHNFAKC